MFVRQTILKVIIVEIALFSLMSASFICRGVLDSLADPADTSYTLLPKNEERRRRTLG